LLPQKVEGEKKRRKRQNLSQQQKKGKPISVRHVGKGRKEGEGKEKKENISSLIRA